MTRFTDKIKLLKKTYITLDEIEELIKPIDYLELVNIVDGMIDSGIIKAVGKFNSKNGKMPSLYVKYRLIKERENNDIFMTEIKNLHTSLNISGYIRNVELYKKHRDIILPLNQFLRVNEEPLKEEMSKNERAYSIWNYEKALDQSDYISVIKFNNIDKKLNYYLTPEPFFDYIHNRNSNMTILIVENKDTWFTLRKLLNGEPEKCCLFGKKIDGLLYGEGNKISKPFALEQYQSEVLNCNCKFLYFGDLDFTGIELFLRVRKHNPISDITLFTDIYSFMLDICNMEKLGEIKNNQSQDIEMKEFLSLFTEDNIMKIEEILFNYKYIPQEIINYQILKKLLK